MRGVEDQPLNASARWEYWKSKIIHPKTENVEADLISLIRDYYPEIKRSKAQGAERIYAEIVYYMNDRDAHHGCFISKELVGLLFGLEMELDFDVVHDLK